MNTHIYIRIHIYELMNANDLLVVIAALNTQIEWKKYLSLLCYQSLTQFAEVLRSRIKPKLCLYNRSFEFVISSLDKIKRLGCPL